MTLTMKNVFSSHIDKVGYDPDTEELYVDYTKGQDVVYKDVPPDVADVILTAPSVGTAVHQLIKKGGYAFERR